MWKLSDALLAFAVITLIAGVVLMLCYILLDREDCNDESNHNLNRASLLLLATVAIGVFVLVFQRREAAEFVKALM